MTTVAAITSYSMANLRTKLRELIDHGIYAIDLYCFCPQDLADICDGSTGDRWPDVLLNCLDPSKAADKIAQIVRQLQKGRTKRPVDICALASFLPDISLPDRCPFGSERRNVTVRVLERLLELVAELRKRGFSCRAFELVAGHSIVRVDEASASGKPQLRRIDPNDCFEALAKSVSELDKIIDRIFPGSDPKQESSRPIMAFEVEPGAGKLLNGENLDRLQPLLRSFPGFGLNLDIGHMLILRVDPDELLGSSLADRIAHAHISDNANSHFADLRIGAYHEREVFGQWLSALANHFQQCKGLFQGCVSIEMEACGSVDMVQDAVLITEELLSGTSPR